MMQQVLESMYEPLFLECSYGFRPGKSCHDAIKALQKHLYKNEIQTVIDIDLKNFFGTIDHELLEDILKQKIKNTKFMRYINRMFKAGVLFEGELRMSEEGVLNYSEHEKRLFLSMKGKPLDRTSVWKLVKDYAIPLWSLV